MTHFVNSQELTEHYDAVCRRFACTECPFRVKHRKQLEKHHKYKHGTPEQVIIGSPCSEYYTQIYTSEVLCA